MAALGSLVVSIEANMAKFQQDMSKTAYLTEQAMNKMEASANLARDAIIGLGAGMAGALSVGLVVDAVNTVIDSLAQLDDFAQQTGASVENLSRISDVAATFGQNFDEVGGVLVKLAKGMNGVDEESSKVKAGLDALGISTQGLKDKDPSEVFVQVARRLTEYRDGAGKTALVNDVLGKSAAGMLPFMNDLADNIEKFQGVSNAAAAEAAAFQDQLGFLRNGFQQVMRGVVIDALPAMNSFLTAVLNTRGETAALANDRNIATWADNAARAAAFVTDSFRAVVSVFQLVGTVIGGLAASAAASSSGNMGGVKVVMDAMKKDIEDIRSKKSVLDELNKEIANRPAAAAAAAPPPDRPALRYSSPKSAAAASGGEDPARAMRDAALKKIENALAAERDALKFHDDYLAELRAQELIDYQTYDEAMQASRDAGLRASLAAYGKEIKALEDYRAKATKEAERANAALKIEETRGKRERAVQDAAQANVMAAAAQGRAQSDLRKSMDDWARQQVQNLALMREDVEMMGLSRVEIAKLTAARRIQADVESQIARAKEKGNVSEDEIAGYRRQAAEAIAASNAVYDAGDAKSKDPYFNIRESLRQYGEEAGNTGKQIGDALTNAFHSAEDALTQFAMTGKFSFSDLTKSILSDLARIAAKNLTVSLAGQAGGFFSNLLGSLAGARAEGGAVFGGSTYLVGEKGPEIFKAPASGTIIPNNALSSMSSAPSIQVSNSYSIDSRTDQSTIMQMLERNRAQTKADIQYEISRSRNAYARA